MKMPSLQKTLKQIYEDMDTRIEQFSSITAWVNELKRRYIAELGKVTQKIRDVFQECWLDDFGENSEIYESDLEERVLGLLVDPSKVRSTRQVEGEKEQ